MGYLTTITIYNDSAHQIKKNSKEFADVIDQATHGIQLKKGHDVVGLGGHDLITLQKPRHADDHTLYMHAGNTVTDVFDADSEWAIDTFISEMEHHLERLKKKRKELNQG